MQVSRLYELDCYLEPYLVMLRQHTCTPVLLNCCRAVVLPVLFYCALLFCCSLSCYVSSCIRTVVLLFCLTVVLLSCWLPWYADVCMLQDAMASAAGMEGVLVMLHDKEAAAKGKAASTAVGSGEGNDVSLNENGTLQTKLAVYEISTV